MSDLPAGWEWAVFSDVAEVASDLVDPADHPDAPHIAPNHIAPWTGKLLPFTTIAADRVTSSKHRFRSGQLLYSKIRPYLAKVVEADFDGLCSADMYPINCRIDRRFLKWWMLTPEFTEATGKHQGRSLLPKINATALAGVPVPVAPLLEQRRIVAALDDHLSHLNAGVATLKRAARKLQDARSSHTQALLSQLGPELPLAECLREPLRNGHSGPASQRADAVRTLTLTAVTTSHFSDENTKMADVAGRKIDDLWLQPGDIFVQRANTAELVGTSAVYSGEPNWAIFPDLLIRVRTNKRLLPEFTQLALSSRAVHDCLRQSAKGLASSMPKIDQAALLRLHVPVPAIEQQREVARRAREFADNIGRLSAAMKSAQHQSDQLRRSLLAEAFAGRLVPQDPSDEPASVLLDRIRAERAAQPTTRRTRRAAAP